MARFTVDQNVTTEWGPGRISAVSARRIVITLDTGDVVNIVTGTPGYDRVAIAPHAVVNNANSKLLQIQRIADDVNTPTPQRMAAIAALVDDFRDAVEGSTGDPFRS